MPKEKNVNEEAYTNRELWLLIQSNNEKNQLQHDAIIESLKNFHENTNETLEKLLAQTTRTNGRVSKLEVWRGGIIASIALLGFLIPLILTYAK